MGTFVITLSHISSFFLRRIFRNILRCKFESKDWKKVSPKCYIHSILKQVSFWMFWGFLECRCVMMSIWYRERVYGLYYISYLIWYIVQMPLVHWENMPLNNDTWYFNNRCYIDINTMITDNFLFGYLASGMFYCNYVKYFKKNILLNYILTLPVNFNVARVLNTPFLKLYILIYIPSKFYQDIFVWEHQNFPC